MSYPAACYNAVFEAMKGAFGTTWYDSIQPFQWNAWRRRIKADFFDQDILIREMVAGLEEAAGKNQWPRGTSFFKRLQDVCLKNRYESMRRGGIHVDGMKRLGDLMPHT